MIRRPPRSTLFPYTPLSRSLRKARVHREGHIRRDEEFVDDHGHRGRQSLPAELGRHRNADPPAVDHLPIGLDRKSTRLNSSHLVISYAVFCLKKKKTKQPYAPEALEFLLASLPVF